MAEARGEKMVRSVPRARCNFSCAFSRLARISSSLIAVCALNGRSTCCFNSATCASRNACSAAGAAKDGYRNFDRPFSVNELFGAPIAVVIIRRLGSGQEKLDRDELRKRIVAVLSAETTEVSRYVEWDEWVPLGIVATIQFSDRSKAVLEESGGHVCFSDYAGTVWWLRIPVAPKPQP